MIFRIFRRCQSSNATTSGLFYRNRNIEQLASTEPQKATMQGLISYGRHMNQLKLLKSANYVRRELSLRLAHRIHDFHSLPFIVGTNPRIASTYNAYRDAFEQLRVQPEIKTLQENQDFCKSLESMLKAHLSVIPQLAQGMRECRDFMSLEEMDTFVNNMLRTRIGRRVLAEQHIALSKAFMGGNISRNSTRIGIIDTACHAGRTIEKCVKLAREAALARHGVAPLVTVDGHIDTTFIYIPDHIEYILFELLKNALSFQVTAHAANNSTKPLEQDDLRPVQVTICSSPAPQNIKLGRSEATMVTFRISDEGGGIDKSLMPLDDPFKIWSFAAKHLSLPHMSRNGETLMAGKLDDPPTSSTSSIGIGLQLARVFAHYWGGDIKLCTMYGFGTDAYVRIITSGQDMEKLTTADAQLVVHED